MPRNRDTRDTAETIRGAIPGAGLGRGAKHNGTVQSGKQHTRSTHSATDSNDLVTDTAYRHPSTTPDGSVLARLTEPRATGSEQKRASGRTTTLSPDSAEKSPAAASSFAARFGRAIVQHGIAAIPSALFHYQGSLDLSAQEVWFTSYVMCFKWDENLPRVNLSQMEKRVGMGKRSLYRLKERLCEAEYLEVFPVFAENGRQDSSAYDFSGLFEQLERLILADPPRGNPIHTDDADEAGEGDMDDEPAERDMSFMARFGRVIARYGVAAIPQAIFTYQAALGLRPQQVWFIAYIFSYQWKKALPYPSIVKMSARTGYSTVQLHEIKASLVEMGYLRLVPRTTKYGGRDSNAYDFSGLFDAIRAHLQRDHAQSKGIAARSENQAPAPAGRARPSRRRGRTVAQRSMRHRLPAEGDAHLLAHADAELPYQGDSQLLYQGDAELIEEGVAELIWQGDSVLIEESGSKLPEKGDSQFTGESDRQLPVSIRRTPPTKVNRSLQKRVARDVQDVEEIQVEQNKRVDSNHISRRERALPRKPGSEDTSTPSSPYIEAVIDDFSNELNDPDHKTSNVTQALRLWRASGKSEQEFIRLVYEAKQLTRQYQGKNGLRGIENKMAYFFAVLRNLCGLEGEQTNAATRAGVISSGQEKASVRNISTEHEEGGQPPSGHSASVIAARQLWYAALAELQTSIPAQSFQTWLKNTSIAAISGNTVVIAVPSNFAKEWLETRYIRQIADTLYNVLGRRVDVQFEVTVPGGARPR